MKRLLVLGGSGMLGHRMLEVLSGRFETFASVRGGEGGLPAPQAFYSGFVEGRLRVGVDARRFETVTDTLDSVGPEAVINCIGVIRQRPEGSDPVAAIELNSLFPHRLAEACRQRNIWLIHIGTDCVFSGGTGGYTEKDRPDATDLYGRSKALGEPVSRGCLTLRTSIIGRELQRTTGLLEWFLSNRHGSVRGFSNAIWSGLTTGALSELTGWIISQRPWTEGLYHVASEPISKCDLLKRISLALGLGIEVVPVPEPAENRSLCSDRFRSVLGMEIPSLDDMIASLGDDMNRYDEWRGWNVPVRR